MALDRLMPSINASRPGIDQTSPSDRSIPYIHAAFEVTMRRNGRMPRAVEGDHNTRLTLAVLVPARCEAGSTATRCPSFELPGAALRTR